MSDAPKPEDQAHDEAKHDAADPLAGLTTLDWADSVEPEAAPTASATTGSSTAAAAAAADDAKKPGAEKAGAPVLLPAIVQTLNAKGSQPSPADAAKPVRKAPEIVIERPDPKTRRQAPPISAKPTIDAAPRVALAGDRGRPEPRSRRGLWAVAGVAAAASLLVAVAAATTGGAGEEQASAKADSLKGNIAQSEQKLAATEADRKKAEQALVQANRDLEAKRAEVADEQKKFDALSKQRMALQETALKTKTAALAPNASATQLQSTATTDATPPAPKPAAVPVPAERPKIQTQKPAARTDEDSYASVDDRRPMADDLGHDAVGGDLRVFIHIQAGSPSARARGQAIAAELSRQGMDVVIRPVPHAVGRDAVRYFYDSDRGSVAALRRAMRAASPSDEEGPITQDFRDYGVLPRPGTMEIWLS